LSYWVETFYRSPCRSPLGHGVPYFLSRPLLSPVSFFFWGLLVVLLFNSPFPTMSSPLGQLRARRLFSRFFLFAPPPQTFPPPGPCGLFFYLPLTHGRSRDCLAATARFDRLSRFFCFFLFLFSPGRFLVFLFLSRRVFWFLKHNYANGGSASCGIHCPAAPPGFLCPFRQPPPGLFFTSQVETTICDKSVDIFPGFPSVAKHTCIFFL